MYIIKAVYKGQRIYERKMKLPKAAKYFYNELKKLIPPGVDLHFYSNLEVIPPPTEERKKGMLWCSYCGSFRKFKTFTHGKQCPVCGISDNDFYIKKHNHLWKK